MLRRTVATWLLAMGAGVMVGEVLAQARPGTTGGWPGQGLAARVESRLRPLAGPGEQPGAVEADALGPDAGQFGSSRTAEAIRALGQAAGEAGSEVRRGR